MTQQQTPIVPKYSSFFAPFAFFAIKIFFFSLFSGGSFELCPDAQSPCVRDNNSSGWRVEAHFWRFALSGRGQFEKFARLKAEHAGNHIGGELLDLDV